jgi:undecaprenyl diphosphate synthase
MMACVNRKIPRATFYAFSVQNWSRDRSEIENIYTSGKALFERMGPWVKDNNVVVRLVGSKFSLAEQIGHTEADQEENPKVKEAIDLGRKLMAETAKNTGTVITLCVSYGGRGFDANMRVCEFECVCVCVCLCVYAHATVV